MSVGGKNLQKIVLWYYFHLRNSFLSCFGFYYCVLVQYSINFRKSNSGKMQLVQASYGINASILSWIIYSCRLVSNFQLFFFSADVPVDDRNWPPCFPIIHHDIANEIPINAQKLQYLAFASWLGLYPVPCCSSFKRVIGLHFLICS